MSRRRAGSIAALALAAVAILAPAAAFAGARSASSHTVVLKALRFHPGTLTIRTGDTVTWQWEDGHTKHNVTFSGFHSSTMSHGSYTVRFNRRGSFEYHCTIHVREGMRGKIVVD
jgi:plastocyanin